MAEGAPQAQSSRDADPREEVREGLSVVDTGIDVLEVARRLAGLDKAFKRIPGAARAMLFAKVFLALAGTASAEAPDPDSLTNALNTAARTYSMNQAARGNEAKEADAAQVEQQFQSFLDTIQPYVREIRESFGPTPNAMEQRAMRFAFGNIFVAFDNIITAQNLERAKDYDSRLAAVLGAPAAIDDLLEEEFAQLYGPKRVEREQLFEEEAKPEPLDDLNDDGTPKQMGVGLSRYQENMSPQKAESVRVFFQIIRTPAFQTLRRDIIKDKGQLIALEILLHPKWATAEELSWAKDVAKLEQMLGLMNQDAVYKAMQ